MADDGGASVYPVVFSDGEREASEGSIKIRPSMEFKKFQETLCASIGVSPNQITTYLVDNNPKTGERRRVPITCRADFALVAEKKTNCFFLVVLRRSRRRSKPRPRQQQQGIGFEYGDVLVPGSYRLLRRDRPDQVAAFRYWDLEMQRENYARRMMMGKAGLGFDPGRVGGDGSVGVSPAVGAVTEAFCEECTRARAEGRRTAEFHCCVFDEVVGGIRSKAGPVARPH